MTVTIDQLLTFGGERLRLVTPKNAERQTFEAKISWIHGSDLLDPTPFLEPGHLLLTDGSQFPRSGVDQSVFDSYVSRLIEADITGIGFGSQLVHMGIPEGLTHACQQQGLVLIELTDLTPYFDYVKFVANAQTQDATVNALWSYRAQRAITRAALKPDGLGAVLSELGRRIGCDVVLYDASGTRFGMSHTDTQNTEIELELNEHVSMALRQGTRATKIVQIHGQQFTIQTIGSHARLDGAISFGQVSLDQPLLHDLIANVVAIASLVLTQHRMLTETRAELRSVALHELLEGRLEFAQRAVEVLRGILPSAPFTMFVSQTNTDSPVFSELVEHELDVNDGSHFYGSVRGHAVLLVEAEYADALLEALSRQDTTVGISSQVTYDNFMTGFEQAKRAHRRALDLGLPSCHFETLAKEGILELLSTADAKTLADDRVRQLTQAHMSDAQRLIDTARVWVQHDCSWEQASTELGIHRHTLRNRIDTISRTLNLDLRTLEGRLELLATLRLVGTN